MREAQGKALGKALGETQGNAFGETQSHAEIAKNMKNLGLPSKMTEKTIGLGPEAIK
jgi:hypothetical protein